MALFRDQEDNSNMKVLFGIGFDMLFSELYKIMVNKVTFLDFRVGDPPPLLNPLLFSGSIGYKNALFWQQCFFFIHATLHIVITQGGQTCLIEESFAENQKHRRIAKPLCSVNTTTVKNASFTLNDVP